MVGEQAGDGVVPVVAHAAAVRAAAAKKEEACFGSSGQALRLRTRFRLANGQHLASGRCRVGMQVVQSIGFPISSYYDRVERPKEQLGDLVEAKRRAAVVAVVEAAEDPVEMGRGEGKALEHPVAEKDVVGFEDPVSGPSCL